MHSGHRMHGVARRRCRRIADEAQHRRLAQDASPQGGSALFGLLCVPRHRPYLLIRASPRALTRPKMDAIKCNDMSGTLHYASAQGTGTTPPIRPKRAVLSSHRFHPMEGTDLTIPACLPIIDRVIEGWLAMCGWRALIESVNGRT